SYVPLVTWGLSPCMCGVRLQPDPYGRPVQLLLARAGGRLRALVLDAGAAEHAGQRVVALVAGVLVDLILRLRQRDHRGPRLGPHRRIVDRELVVDLGRADAREALDQVQVLARPPDRGPRREGG